MTLGYQEWLQTLTSTLQHTVIFWFIWLLKDIAWRQEYQTRVSRITTEPPTASESSLLQRAHVAYEARHTQKVEIRKVTSPVGLCVIRWFGKQQPEPFLFYADHYSDLSEADKPFQDLEVRSANYNWVNREIQFIY